ncbi:hypothetical protein KF840_13480 [bacterium]|nr:hypothetical protein [bacterium]
MAAKHPWRNTIVTLVVLLPIAAVVVYSSFQVSDFECEVCITFEGRSTCRTVTGKTEQEGLRTGVDNACAILASGVTDTLRCQRTLPTKATCRPLD